MSAHVVGLIEQFLTVDHVRIDELLAKADRRDAPKRQLSTSRS
jgi:hypothetical protein